MSIKRSFLALGTCLLFSQVYAQSRISLDVDNKPLEEVLKELEKKSTYVFLYPDNNNKINKKISAHFKDDTIDKVLSELSGKTDFEYRIQGQQIFIKEKPLGKKSNSQQQQRKITGVISDINGKAISGATVTAVKAGNTVQSDQDGRYEISLRTEEDQLSFSNVGFEPKLVDIKSESSNVNNVILEETVNSLEELVIVGFGQQRRISNIGAQSNLKMADIKTPSASLSTVLAGRLSGVVAVQRSGEPGKDGADIWIRGIATPNSSTPLILVDGVERGFNDIDPEDVESLTTLKDASATAVYGVRGANGVILIKTKPGRAGKTSINADAYRSFTRFTKRVSLIDGIGYMEAANEALSNDGYPVRYSADYIEKTRSGIDPYLYPNVDWMKELFNDWGYNNRVNVNARGGSPIASYYASVSYYNETGMLKTDNIDSYNSQMKFNRYNFTTNLNLKVSPTTIVDIGAQGYLGEGNYPAISSSDIYASAMDVSPVDYPKMFYVNGVAYVPGINPNGGYRNPYADATRRGYSNVTKNQIYSNLRITQELDVLTEGLKASAMFAYDVYNEVELKQTKRESTYYFANRNIPYDLNGQPILVETFAGSNVLGFEQSSTNGVNNKKTYLEASLTYDRAFGKHRFGGLILFNQQDRRIYPVGDLESSIPYRMMGLAGRATYSWDDRYFAEFNIGYNGAENFAPDRRYGTFPAYGVGWVVSNEKFWEPVKDIVSFLKFRYTDGKIGNSNVSDRRFMYLDQIVENGSHGYTWGTGTSKTSGYEVKNNAANVGWEESRKQDLGIDVKLFKETISIVFDVFKERRKDILLKRESSIPDFLGYMSSPYGNIGIVDNKGFDGTIEFNKQLNQDWILSVRGNITYNRSKWVQSEIPDQKYPWMNLNGQSILASKGYVAMGLFTQNEVDDMARWESLSASDQLITPKPFASQFGTVKAGDIKYQDMNGDGVIDAYDQTYIGDGDVPAWIYGFGFNLGYKKINLGVLFQGTEGASRVLSGSSIFPFRGTGGGGNLYSNIGDRWNAENPSQDVFYPRLAYGDDKTSTTNNTQASSWWLKDMSFLRLKTLQISYNLPSALSEKLHFKNAAVYVMGTNLLTLSRFKLWDPELNTTNGTSYPNISTYSVGVNVSF